MKSAVTRGDNKLRALTCQQKKRLKGRIEQNNVILRSFQLTFVFIKIHDSVEEYIFRQTDPETTLTAAYVCCQDNTDYFKIQWVLKRYGGREDFSHHKKVRRAQ